MYSDSLFEKNLKVFQAVRPGLSPDLFSPNRAREKRDLCSADEEACSFNQQNPKAYQLPWYLPRDNEYAQQLSEEYKNFLIPGSVDQYIDIPDKDPHLIKSLLKLREIIIDLGIDPTDTVTTPTSISCFLACGTGDGLFIQNTIEKFQPKNLVVAVSSWDDLLSSFWTIDWSEYTTKLQQEGRSVSIVKAKEKEDIRAHLVSKGLLSSEHCLIYKSMSADPAIIAMADELHGPPLHNTISYLGFQLDEYNMLLNTHRTILKRPKIFSQPTQDLGLGKVIVCGSGPSLDQSIETIKFLSRSHVIVASGSNYHTLRRHGIEVEYLVLVERANNTFDDYKETIDLYGSGDTTLVMSSTCPAELVDLFDETIIFFRPALTPLSLYSDSPTQVLNYEGPESLNGGFAWACALRPQSVVLVGADLGTTSQDKPRSRYANGVSPRTFDIQVEGNLSDVVYTSKPLLDSREVLQNCINHYSQHVVNCSDGVAIKGAIPMTLDAYYSSLESQSLFPIKHPPAYREWRESLCTYDEVRLKTMFAARSPRESVYRTCRELRALFGNPRAIWTDDIVPRLDFILSISQNIRYQFCARVIRGTIYKLFLSMLQQSYVNAKYDIALQQEYIVRSSDLMTSLIDDIELELYSVCDTIEP